MLNEEKIKSMTRAAAYENGPEKKNIEISNYYRTDFLGLQMVKSAVAYAVSFLILTALWAMGRIEELMLNLTRGEYLEKLLFTMALLFIAGLVLYEIAVYAYYSVKYQQAKKSVNEFHAYLKHIHKLYEIQESAAEEKSIKIQEADEEIRI